MHAELRDKYLLYAQILDLSIFASSTWLVAMIFVEPKIGSKLSPSFIQSQIWIGLLSIVTFFLSIVQIKVNWKERSDAHKRSLDMYASVKREAGYILSRDVDVTLDKCGRVIDMYDAASNTCIQVPEKFFLTLKRKHKLKIKISRYLDDKPSASVLLLRLKWWIGDNIARVKKDC